jgi:enoyl-CoA hydratase/carnithine racemase
MTPAIQLETSACVARVAINRPDKKNALTADMYQGLADAIAAAEADTGTRVIVIHGQPGCFCAGNDLNDFLRNPPHGEDAPVTRFLRAISTARKPLVAAVDGPAVGIGTTMLLHCDLIYATARARFHLPFASLGLVPEAASSLLLPLMAGYQRAAELLLLARPFDADQARAAGIVTAIVPEDALLERALEAATTLAALPPESVRTTKALMKQQWAAPVAERMAAESRLFRERLGSPEAKEAFRAFLEKRPADFSRF